jgi:hypothetical protein
LLKFTKIKRHLERPHDIIWKFPVIFKYLKKWAYGILHSFCGIQHAVVAWICRCCLDMGLIHACKGVKTWKGYKLTMTKFWRFYDSLPVEYYFILFLVNPCPPF